MAVCCRERNRLLEECGCPRRCRVGDEAVEAEAGGARNGVRELRSGSRRRDSRAAEPRVAVDEHTKRPGGPGRSGEPREQPRVVHADGQLRPFVQAGEPGELRRSEDVHRHEHVVDAGPDHRLGLEQRLAGDADGAELDLPLRDLDALVRLHVRPVAQADPVALSLPAGEIALEPVEIDDRGRRLDHGMRATASISTSSPPGSPAPTVVRAGYGSVKNSA